MLFMLICIDPTFLPIVDWFSSTLDIPRVADVVMHDASTEYVEMTNTDLGPSEVAQIPQPKTVAIEKPKEVPALILASHEHRNFLPAANPPHYDALPTTKAQKGKRRKKRKRVMEEPAVQAALEARPLSGGRETTVPRVETAPSQVPPLPPTTVPSPPNLPSDGYSGSISEQTSLPSSQNSTPIMATMSSPPPANDPISNHRQGALAMKAGFITQGVSCMPQINLMRAHSKAGRQIFST